MHEAGAFFYCDGANFNAIVGRVRPGDLGIDCMHINLHKTFSTPHGGGGPGAGPVVLSAALAPYAPCPWIVKDGETWRIAEDGTEGDGTPLGRLKAFHGQMGMFIRALAYMMSHGADGLRQVAEDAVLKANYVMASLQDVMTPAFAGPCMHEALFDDGFLKDTGVTTLDFAKAHDRRGLSPDDHVLPAGGAWRDADRADRDREPRRISTSSSRRCASWPTGQGGRRPPASRRRRASRRAAGSTRPLAARKPVLRWRPSNNPPEGDPLKQAAE